MEPLKVALPAALAGPVSEDVGDAAEIVAWDGEPPVPAHVTDVTVWVPSYPGGVDDGTVTDSLRGLPRLRVLQLLSAGVEPWPRLVPSGVTLCSGRSIHGASTAELAVAGLLAVLRDLPLYLRQQQHRDWTPHQPRTVAGRRVLVLGAGDIGQRVAAALGALDAEVLLVARRSRPGVLTLEQVPEILPTVDAVVVTLPHTDETAGLVDRSFLAALADGAVVVNVARGAVVDTSALTAEVSAGRLRAALDVTDPEPLPTEHPLWGLSGVLLTPHVGGGATGWELRARRLLTEQLTRLRDGAELLNVVTHGY
ncbi:MAG: D-3-phosphoglycerate dehydrogenase [uncultured Nocardioidaceae bacterium]|uniref:D-3-phosphoglycerate dehydrogenase n=1 Tax=uncultured Nocardioidaceae bacterium TaxID=253824 RepID=A0A6J4MRY9_9ACTN|nr:MAG: D-3-phosphoglycerate dehydrogenase [uncultured Nocardioidaceae bacterium]